MGGPLDDALGKHDRNREQLQQQLRDNHVKMQALIEDFLTRMHAAGDPGTRNLSKHPPEWPVIPRLGWEINIEDESLRVFRTGKVLYWNPRYYFGPLRNADLGYLGFHAEEFAQEMAFILRKNGVSLRAGHLSSAEP